MSANTSLVSSLENCLEFFQLPQLIVLSTDQPSV